MKILLNGYFYQNLGDDLFFHLITERYPQHTFFVPIHGDYAHSYRGKPNVKILPQTKWKRGVDKLLGKISPKLTITGRLTRRTDLGVLIGGSMFQELPDAQSRIARMPRHPKGQLVLGVSFGPHKTQGYVELCREYLKTVTDVCFRDSVSYDHFSQLPNTRLGSDMVFAIQDLCPAPAEKENTCVISVMDFAAKAALAPYEKDYLGFLRRTIRKQLELGRKVILLSFCKFEGDENTMQTLLREYPQCCALGYDGTNYTEICRCIGAAGCLIASRFHSMVLGLAYGVPTVPISYSNKTMQLLQDLGCAELAITPEMLSGAQADRPIAPMDLAPWIEKAQLHFAKLDQIERN